MTFPQLLDAMNRPLPVARNRSNFGIRSRCSVWFASAATAALLLDSVLLGAEAPAVPSLLQDRLAIARVYYNRQTGEKPVFEKAVPVEVIQRNLTLDQLKETVLSKVYGTQVSTAMVEAEIKRIQTTTLAPDTLSELWAAVGKSPERFGAAIARPLVIERLLREKFESDPNVHIPHRKRMEALRAELLSTPTAERVQKLKSLPDARNQSWHLSKRSPDQSLPPTTSTPDERGFFEDLPPDLQKVLAAQLAKPADVSAVIETPTHFLLYLLKARSNQTLDVTWVPSPKRSFDEWFTEQTKGLQR